MASAIEKLEIRDGITFHQHDISPLSWRNSTNLILHAEKFSTIARCSLNHL